MSAVRPALSLLLPDHIAAIHASSLRILNTIGVRIDSARARRIFEGATSGVTLKGDRAYFEREVVEWAIEVSPPNVDIYNRRGDKVFTLGADGTHFGVGVTNLYFQDPMTDELHPFAREHMAAGVRLCSALPAYEFVSTLGVLRDLPPVVADLYAVLEMVANTTRPLVILISDEKLFVPALDMVEAAYRNPGERPFIIPYLNPVTPMVMNEGTGDKLLDSIERGLPPIYSNYGMAGMSTPITPAGALAMLNAELLAGLVLSQLAKEGAPIILGSLPAYFDMKTMVDFYDPQTFLINLCCAEMMNHYHIPHAGTSGSGEGWGPDLLAAGNLWMNHLTSLIGKAGLVPFVGSSLNSKAYSPALTVYGSEVIAQARLFANGFPFDEASIGVEEMIEVMATDGHFLTSPTTLQRYKSGYYQGIFPHLGLEKWVELGHPDANRLIRERARDLLAEAPAPEDREEIIGKGEAFIRAKYPA